jgi:hypothetical protein
VAEADRVVDLSAPARWIPPRWPCCSAGRRANGAGRKLSIVGAAGAAQPGALYDVDAILPLAR